MRPTFWAAIEPGASVSWGDCGYFAVWLDLAAAAGSSVISACAGSMKFIGTIGRSEFAGCMAS
jgi:hypothetical protein